MHQARSTPNSHCRTGARDGESPAEGRNEGRQRPNHAMELKRRRRNNGFDEVTERQCIEPHFAQVSGTRRKVKAGQG